MLTKTLRNVSIFAHDRGRNLELGRKTIVVSGCRKFGKRLLSVPLLSGEFGVK